MEGKACVAAEHISVSTNETAFLRDLDKHKRILVRITVRNTGTWTA